MEKHAVKRRDGPNRAGTGRRRRRDRCRQRPDGRQYGRGSGGLVRMPEMRREDAASSGKAVQFVGLPEVRYADGKRLALGTETLWQDGAGTVTKAGRVTYAGTGVYTKEVKQMPRGDGTGPMGMGPMTGRGRGACAGFAGPGYMNNWCGMGRGRGFRRMYNITGLPAWARYGAYPYEGTGKEAPVMNERQALQKQAAFLEKQLKQIQKRLDSMEEAE